MLIKVNLDNGLRNNKISVQGKKYEGKVSKKYNFHLINIILLYLWKLEKCSALFNNNNNYSLN